MCDPLTMMAVGGQVAGKIYEGFSSGDAHDRASDLASLNADLLGKQGAIKEGNAALAVTRGNYDEFLTRRKGDHVLASQTAAYASGNVDPTYGSPLVVAGYSAAQIEQDAQIVRARMMVDRANELTGAASVYAQAAGQAGKAEAERVAANTARISGIIGAGTSLLSSGSKAMQLGAGPGGGGDYASGINFASNPFILQQPTDI